MKNALLSASASGAFWLLFLFFVCFFGVHTVRLAKLGWKYRKQPPAAPSEKKPAGVRLPSRAEALPGTRRREPPQAPAPTPEPVYYIVERKRRKTRDSYSPPREIRFK